MVGPWDPVDSHSSLDLVCVPSEAFIWPDPELHLLQVLHIQKYVLVVSVSFIWPFTDNWPWHHVELLLVCSTQGYSPSIHPSIHPCIHPPSILCVCRVKGLGSFFGTLALSSMMDLANLNYLLHGQVAHDFCGFAANSFCFWGVHHQTCSIQSTSWWILGLVESSLCFGYCFVLVAELFGGWMPLHVCPLTQNSYGKLLYPEIYILKPTKFRHPKNTGCTQPEVDIVTTDKVLLSLLQTSCSTTVLCVGGEKLKISEYLHQLLLQLAMWYMQSSTFTLEGKSHMKKKHGGYAPLLSSCG